MKSIDVLYRGFIISAFLVIQLINCGSPPNGRINPCDPESKNYVWVNAGTDTTIAMYESLTLKGLVSENAKNIKWEWKIGENKWVETSSGDTTIITPGYTGDFICSLKITADKNIFKYSARRCRLVTGNKKLVSISIEDTNAEVGDTVTLSADISDFITLSTMHWKIGDEEWIIASARDTNLIFSKYYSNCLCSLRIWNEWGTKLHAAQEIVVSFSKIKQASAAYSSNHSMLLREDGTLWATGRNYCGQLGDSSRKDSFIPKKIMDDVAFVSTGNSHTLILKTDRTLWGCGHNAYGQLGIGTSQFKVFPVKIMDNVAFMSAGGMFSMVVKEDGTLFAMGHNDFGQLGTGNDTDATEPVKIFENVNQVSAGYNYAMILKKDGTLWATGNNNYGQLGDSTYEDKHTPVQVMNEVDYVAATGRVRDYQGKYPGHTMIIKKDRTLWTTGCNRSGQLGDGTTHSRNAAVQIMSDVSSVSGGSNGTTGSADKRFGHTMILKNDGTLWAVGDNIDGELGNGTTESKTIPIQVMSDVAFVSAGSGYTLVIKNDKTLWITGANKYGQLGDGTGLNRLSFVKL